MPIDLDTAVQWGATRTVIVQHKRLGSLGNFIAPNIMAKLGDPGVLKFRYFDVTLQNWSEGHSCLIGGDWTDLGYASLQVRRTPSDPNAIEVRWPAGARTT